MAETLFYGNALVRAFTELAGGGAAKTAKVMLLSDVAVFNSAHVYASEISAAEATGTGYTAGGLTLAGVTYTYSGGLFKMDANDLAPAGLSVVCRYAAVYLSTGTLATSPLITLTDLTEAVGETLEVTALGIHPVGLFTVIVPT